MTRALRQTVSAVAFLALAGAGLSAQAQTARVRCDTFPARSSASVDGKSLAPGNYAAVLISGTHRSQSAYEPAVNGEVQVDFDSNPKDVAAGDTKIAKDFIVGGTVTGRIIDVDGKIVARETVTCKAH